MSKKVKAPKWFILDDFITINELRGNTYPMVRLKYVSQIICNFPADIVDIYFMDSKGNYIATWQFHDPEEFWVVWDNIKDLLLNTE